MGKAWFLFLGLYSVVMLAVGWSIYFSRKSGRFLRSVVVVCETCGSARVGNETASGRFFRGRARVAGLKRLLVPALLFLLVVSLYSWISTRQVPLTGILTYAFLGVAYTARRTMMSLILPIARVGLRFFGHTSTQFMIVWQRNSRYGSSRLSRRSDVARSRVSAMKR